MADGVDGSHRAADDQISEMASHRRAAHRLSGQAQRGHPDCGTSVNGCDQAGYRSLLHGKRPHAAGYPTSHAEIAALVERVGKWLEQGVAANEIAVCARFNTNLGDVQEALTAAGIPAVRVRDQPAADVDGVRLATMHAMKGLEFRRGGGRRYGAGGAVAKEVTPAEVDPMQHESDLLRERCLLLVASTRAREALHVSWSGQSSPFLAFVATR